MLSLADRPRPGSTYRAHLRGEESEMKVDVVDISKIDPNPENPRGIDIAREDTKLPALKDSIKQFGILVPLVLVPRGRRYLLLDGERRFVAAQALGLKTLPAFITERGLDDDDLLVRMFQIHHNQQQWGAIQQCRALEGPYRSISGRRSIVAIGNDRARIKAIAEELSRATGIDLLTAENRIWFLRWPKSFKKRRYKGNAKGYWYVCEIESRIIIPALENYPEYFEKVSADDVRLALYEKLEKKAVSAATEVRAASIIVSKAMRKKSARKSVKRILTALHKNHDMTYGEAREDFIREFPSVIKKLSHTPRKLFNAMEALAAVIEDFDASTISQYKHRAKIAPKKLLASAKNLASVVSKLAGDLEDVV